MERAAVIILVVLCCATGLTSLTTTHSTTMQSSTKTSTITSFSTNYTSNTSSTTDSTLTTAELTSATTSGTSSSRTENVTQQPTSIETDITTQSTESSTSTETSVKTQTSETSMSTKANEATQPTASTTSTESNVTKQSPDTPTEANVTTQTSETSNTTKATETTQSTASPTSSESKVTTQSPYTSTEANVTTQTSDTSITTAVNETTQSTASTTSTESNVTTQSPDTSTEANVTTQTSEISNTTEANETTQFTASPTSTESNVTTQSPYTSISTKANVTTQSAVVSSTKLDTIATFSTSLTSNKDNTTAASTTVQSTTSNTTVSLSTSPTTIKKTTTSSTQKTTTTNTSTNTSTTTTTSSTVQSSTEQESVISPSGSDMTGAVIGALVAVIVAMAVTGGAMLYLKRRQALCFRKYDEIELMKDSRQSTVHEMKNMTISTPRASKRFFPRQIHLADFPAFVETLSKDSGLLFADGFRMVQENSPNHPKLAADLEPSRPKNRYIDILAFDHSRVKLKAIDDDECSDYINANYIPGYNSPREYIATQGPIIPTIDDFWRMIWEHDIDTIVMLTKLVEKGKPKCDKYWPDPHEPLIYGEISVSIKSESTMPDFIIRIFDVQMKDEKKLVRQFVFLDWPDMGCPENPLSLLNFVKAVRQYTSGNRDTKGPVVVHCSAGVGRTGTYIAVDHLLQHIRECDEVDIHSLVLAMRNHRCRMVQTEDQYVFIHQCLNEFITNNDEEEDEEDDDGEGNTFNEPLYENTSATVNVFENAGFTFD